MTSRGCRADGHRHFGAAQVVHDSLGHPCRVEARHDRDDSRLVPVATVPLKTSHIHIHQFRDLVPGEGLTDLGGPLFEPWLLQIPRERALDSERIFIRLALRLQNTPAALERLRQLGIR